eukprot:g3951.t1
MPRPVVNWRNVPVTVEAAVAVWVQWRRVTKVKKRPQMAKWTQHWTGSMRLCSWCQRPSMRADKLSRIQSLVQKRAGKLPLGAPERHFCREVRRICVSRRICEPRR